MLRPFAWAFSDKVEIPYIGAYYILRPRCRALIRSCALIRITIGELAL